MLRQLKPSQLRRKQAEKLLARPESVRNCGNPLDTLPKRPISRKVGARAVPAAAAKPGAGCASRKAAMPFWKDSRFCWRDSVSDVEDPIPIGSPQLGFLDDFASMKARQEICDLVASQDGVNTPISSFSAPPRILWYRSHDEFTSTDSSNKQSKSVSEECRELRPLPRCSVNWSTQ